MSPERERKRKRDANGQPRPVASSSTDSAQTVKLNSVPAGSHPPILASIHGVELPTDLTFTAYDKKVKKSKQTPGGTAFEVRGKEYCLQGQTARIEYEGREEGDDGLLYYVGVYDPETASVDVYPAPLLHVRRQVRRLKEKERDMPDKLSTGTLLDSRQALSAAFGNRTSKKALLDEQLNAITSSTLGDTASSAVVSAIASAVDTATALLPTSESLRQGQGNSKYLPPVHADEEGVTVDRVYRLEEMLDAKIMEKLNVGDWEQAVRQGQDVSSTISPHYVSSRIQAIIDSEYKVLTRLRILRYIEHLIQFHRIFIAAFSNTLFRGKVYDGLAADDKSIANHLMDTFTDAKNQNKNDRHMSKTKLTRLYCWLLILCLKVEEDARMDIFDIVQDLQIDRKDVEMAAREVGARVKEFPESYFKMMGIKKDEAREHRHVSLSLPLVFPRNKMPVRKR